MSHLILAAAWGSGAYKGLGTQGPGTQGPRDPMAQTHAHTQTMSQTGV